MIRFEASILSADLMRLESQVQDAVAAGIDGIQIDVMDGRFVPPITFGDNIVKAVRSVTDTVLDVHLMIVEPDEQIETFVEAGADRIFIHQEASLHLHRTLQSIRKAGVEAGVSINPGTSWTVLEEVLELTDIIQVMTVNPGWGGQSFIHGQLEKIRTLDKVLRKRKLDVPIAVDGGIDPITAPLVVEAGASVLIAGSSIYNDRAPVDVNIKALRQSVASSK